MHRLKLLLAALVAISFSQPALAQTAAKQKAVLVTGASSGIGLAITEYLAAKGFHVYAGARKDEDLKRLNEMKNVSSVRLDVTKQADIDAAVQFVTAQGRGLYGVVNNAGVASVAELIKVTDQDVLWQHDINVMGPLRVNRAFFPLLKESKGRTAVIGSLSAFVMSPTGGAYGMTKAALEAYTETLAIELKDTGVTAGIIDSGAYKSHAREKVAMQMLTGKPDLNQQLTPEQKKVLDDVREAESKLTEPTPVAEQVFHFLTSDKPRLHYMAAQNEKTAHTIVRAVIDLAAQLNASQPAYTLKRDDLVKLLDDVLAGQKIGQK